MVVNKYARMVVAMINDIFGFYMMNARCKSVFVFSDLIMAENSKWVKVVEKVFLMIKNGPGFMVSQMHSLFNKVVDNGTLELTYEIATKRFHDKLLIIWASRPNIETFWLLVSLILHQDANKIITPQ